MKTIPVRVGSTDIGSESFVVVAGPCSIEDEQQLTQIAQELNQKELSFLRGGLFKLRSSPNSFQGLGDIGFDLVRKLKAQFHFQFVCEISDPRHITDYLELVDLFQVGSRNMHNYALLKELGGYNKPVLLKRGFCATIDEWLLAAEYLTKGSCPGVILCERGIRTFETKMRNTLDLATVAYLKEHTPFPVLVDPSHGTGRRELVIPMSLAAVSAGADGLLIEVHPSPDTALSDGFQTLDFVEFGSLLEQLKRLLNFYGRSWV